MRKIALILFAGAALATAAYAQETSPEASTPPAAKCCGENAKCCQDKKDCCNPKTDKKANAKHEHGNAKAMGCCK